MIVDISHGLQTPLAILKNELEKLEERFPETKSIKTFEQSVDLVSKFIYDLLTLSRLEHVPEKEPEESVDLSALCSEIVEYVRIPAEAAHIRMTETIMPHVMVKGEKDRLKEAVINLLSNAIKYMKEGGPREIHLGLHTENKHAILTIKDTGIGIAASDLPNLFERFYRAREGNTGCPKGTGLGLAITKRIVLRHHGVITAESTLGKGTCFTITLNAEPHA
jgi:two-component system phosphate regulon sensor histidine kinase PhoR